MQNLKTMDKVNFRQVTPEIRQTDEQKAQRKVTFVASDSTRDSAGTVLNQKGWDLRRFNANGIIGYQHKVYGGWDDTDNPDNVIGKGFAYVEDDKLMVDVEFEPAEINPLAEKIYQKILFGSLKAVSVGFLPLGRGAWGKGDEAIGEKNETYYYAGQELLEVSVVNIPANPNALKKSFIAEAQEEEQRRIREEAITEDTTAIDEGTVSTHPEDNSAATRAAFDLEVQLARAALL